MYTDLTRVAEQAQLLLAELAELSQTGPLLKIVHRFHAPGTTCLPGEEVWAVLLVRQGRDFRLPLPLALRVLLNYLAGTSHVPQSATQIVAGMRRSAFYLKHGANSGMTSRRRIARSAVKEYIKRLRIALSSALQESELNLDSARVLVSRKTMGNEVQYQLRATIQWVHV